MTRPAAIDIAPEQRLLVLQILRANLPPEAEVWAFGSRATGRARPYSDLDLAIDCGRRLTIDEAAILREAFTESDLPYKVDFVDWRAIDDAFRGLITTECALISSAAEDEKAVPRLDDIRRRIGAIRSPSVLQGRRHDRNRDGE